MNLQNTLLTAALGLITSAMTAQAAPVPPNYTMAAIPFLPGATADNTFITAINVEGDVVGTGGQHAFLYRKGKLIDIEALFPSSLNVTSSYAGAINAFDEVIGTYNVAGNGYNKPAGSFIYYGVQGRLELLPNPPGFVTEVGGLNDLGQISGGYVSLTDPDNTGGYSWLRQVNGRIAPLPLFNGARVGGGQLNNLGQIATIATTGTFTLTTYDYTYTVDVKHVLLITGQHIQDLMASVLPTTYLDVQISGLNDFGAVAGSTELADGLGDDQPQHATLFFGGQVTDLGGVQGPIGPHADLFYGNGEFEGASYLRGINDFGTMVGGENSGFDAEYFGFIVVNGVLYDINNYIPNPVVNGVKLDVIEGVAINNAGQILAYACPADGSGLVSYYNVTYPVLLTPIPVKALRP